MEVSILHKLKLIRELISITMNTKDCYHECSHTCFSSLRRQIQQSSSTSSAVSWRSIWRRSRTCLTVRCTLCVKVGSIAKRNNLHVKEEKGKGIYVSDATEVYVSSPEEMFEVMRAGSKNRSIAATRMNEKSSRSHSIFLLTVYQKNTATDAAKMGKLYLCDLAGSEKLSKTQASG